MWERRRARSHVLAVLQRGSWRGEQSELEGTGGLGWLGNIFSKVLREQNPSGLLS